MNSQAPQTAQLLSSDLPGFAEDVYSQNGEDGILKEVLNRLGVMDRDGPKWCVEFGAWDGVHLSNTCNLIRNFDFHAVLIEANTARFKDLCRNFPQDEVAKINRLVALTGDQRLDAILQETDIPTDFDMLSIDIDGCDYHVWKSLEAFQPKLVIIEFNPTIPVDVPYIQAADFNVQQGSGVKAMDDLARAKGYTTVCVHGGNLIAVRNDLVTAVTSEPPPPIEDMADPDARMFLFVGYDGTVLSNRDSLPMSWHPTDIPLSELQVLPRGLRQFSGRYGPLKWAWFGLLDIWRRMRRSLLG
jgi:hypothetical protein